MRLADPPHVRAEFIWNAKMRQRTRLALRASPPWMDLCVCWAGVVATEPEGWHCTNGILTCRLQRSSELYIKLPLTHSGQDVSASVSLKCLSTILMQGSAQKMTLTPP